MARPKKVTPQVPGQPVAELEQPVIVEPAPAPAPAPAKPAEEPKQSIKPILTDRGYIVKG